MEGNVAIFISKENDNGEEWDFQASVAVEEQEKFTTTSIIESDDAMALIRISDKLISYDNDWIVDAGCSNHMIGDQDKLSSMSKYTGGQVVVTANNSRLPITQVN